MPRLSGASGIRDQGTIGGGPKLCRRSRLCGRQIRMPEGGKASTRVRLCDRVMIFSFDLLINAIVSGLLLGGFYAAVTSGVSLSFGILDIVNIAHPAFIILGSYIAYIVNATFRVDPILTSLVLAPAFYLLG